VAGLGFKIADGYVEVHAHYDKGELRRAAQQAADDNDRAFDKERERNARSGQSRDTNRRIGGLAGEHFTQGMRDQISRQKDNPIIRVDDVKRDASRLGRVHVAAFGQAVDQDVDRRRNLFQRIGGKISRHLRSGMLRDVATAGPAFGQRFIEAITFGQADMQKIATTGKISKVFAGLGTALGATLAVALVAEIGNAVTALLPLALGGALLALPIINIFKKHSEVKKGHRKWDNSEIGKAMKDMLHQASVLGDKLERIFAPAFTTIVAGFGATLKALQKPLGDLVSALTPAAVDLATGFFAAIQTFVTGIGPSMPGIAAGFREWAVQLPGIAAALAGLFNAILANPDLVVTSIRTFAETLRLISGLAGVLIPFLTRLANLLHIVGSGFSLGARAAAALQPLLAAMFKPYNGWDAWFRPFMARFIAFFRGVPALLTSAVAAIGAWGDKVAAKIQAGQNRITAAAKRIVTAVVDWLKQLPGKAAAAVSSLWARMKGAFDHAASSGKARAKQAVDGVVNFFKTLPGKAASAVSSLWSRMSGAFSRAISQARSAATRLVSGFINVLRTIVAKARAAVARVPAAVRSVFAGAGSWLVGAGRSIVSGLARGILSGVGAVISAARSVAARAVAAAKSALKIHSPSQVFAEQVGKPSAQGIAKGMKDNYPKEMGFLSKGLPRMAMAGGHIDHRSYSTSFSPNVVVHVQAGLETVNSAAKRALTRDIFLALEAYKKDYL